MFLPADLSGVAGIVEAVLGAGGAVAVEEDFEASCTGPCYGVVEVSRGARKVRGI